MARSIDVATVTNHPGMLFGGGPLICTAMEYGEVLEQVPAQRR